MTLLYNPTLYLYNLSILSKSKKHRTNNKNSNILIELSRVKRAAGITSAADPKGTVGVREFVRIGVMFSV